MQVSHSKKWKSQKALDNEGNEILYDKGKPILMNKQTKVDRKKYQQIDIYYSGVGIISVSANEYDFEKEFQNMLKNQIKTA